MVNWWSQEPEVILDPTGKSPTTLWVHLTRTVLLRHWKLHFWQTLALVLILAVGVATFLSVQIANRAAVSSFGQFSETISGEADWVLEPNAGALPEWELRRLRVLFETLPVRMVPVVEAQAMREQRGKPFHLVGLDVVALTDVITGSGSQVKRAQNWQGQKGLLGVWVPAASPFEEGEQVTLYVGDSVVEVEVRGKMAADPGKPRADGRMMFADLPALQKAAHREGQLDRIELRLPPGPLATRDAAALRSIVEREGGTVWTAKEPASRRQTGETMTKAFRLNLTVLSLIALIVGLYLIYQAIDGSVLRRRKEIAVLKSLGVTRRQVLIIWSAGSVALGLVGGLVGLGLGWAGAQLAVRAVGQTVNALYFETTITSAGLRAEEVVIGLLVSVLVSVIAGWIPAREAAQTPSAQLLGRTEHVISTKHPLLVLLLGLVFLGVGVALARTPGLAVAGGGRFPLGGYLAAFLWIMGAGLVAGHGLGGVARLMPGGASTAVHLARSQVRQPGSRHRLAVAALVCAVGMTAGMAIMVASFERSVTGWISQSLKADLYVTGSALGGTGPANRLSPETLALMSKDPDVSDVIPLSIRQITLKGLPTQLNGLQMSEVARRDSALWLQRPDFEAVLASVERAAFASESFCSRYGVSLGDTVPLPTPSGVRTVKIMGVFADYGNERGSIMVDLAAQQRWFSDSSITHVSLVVKPDAGVEGLEERLRRRYPSLRYFRNGDLRAEILRVFRQTFGITYALEVLGVTVALAGLGLTLASMLSERRDQLTTLRALGLTRREIALSTAWEGTLLSGAAALGGLLLSMGLGWLLVHVINRQSFGWTLAFHIPAVSLVILGGAVVLLGAGVSYAVGYWGGALPADQEE